MSPKEGRILIVDDDEDVLQAGRLYLKQHFEAVQTEKSPERVPDLLKQATYDVILLDMNFTHDTSSGQEGFHWLGRILEIDPQAVVILITAYGDIEMAVRAIKTGATDFVLKPWQNEKLLATISAGIALRQTRDEVVDLKSRERQLTADLGQQYHSFIGSSAPMQAVFKTISKVANTDANVLILGESGTGKELVAREFHRQSPRADESFIVVDLGAVSETLFESELFGHKKGAFTDAREDRAGRFETATGGTLFLDEIGNLPRSLQPKLLTVLENRTVTRIGTNSPRPIDVRLVSATNMDLQAMVTENLFRQDLLYRINTVEIIIPPLRERLEDIPALVDHFLQRYARKYNKHISSALQTTYDRLAGYNWPGNVRELQHAVERAVILSDSETLAPNDFLLPGATGSGQEPTLDTLKLDDVEKDVIRQAITKHSGNITRAAKELGLTRTSLYRRMQKYGL